MREVNFSETLRKLDRVGRVVQVGDGVVLEDECFKVSKIIEDREVREGGEVTVFEGYARDRLRELSNTEVVQLFEMVAGDCEA